MSGESNRIPFGTCFTRGPRCLQAGERNDQGNWRDNKKFRERIGKVVLLKGSISKGNEGLLEKWVGRREGIRVVVGMLGPHEIATGKAKLGTPNSDLYWYGW